MFLKTQTEGFFADKGDVFKTLSAIKRYGFKGNHNVLVKTDYFIIDDYLAGPNIVDIQQDRGSTSKTSIHDRYLRLYGDTVREKGCLSVMVSCTMLKVKWYVLIMRIRTGYKSIFQSYHLLVKRICQWVVCVSWKFISIRSATLGK